MRSSARASAIALPLPAGKPAAAGPDRGREPQRQVLDEPGRRGPRRLLHLPVVGAGPAHADIGRDRVVEQQRVLADIGDRVAQARQRHVADVRAVDRDAAALDIRQAGDQRQRRALAGAGRSDQGHGQARRRLEGQVAQPRRARPDRRSPRNRTAAGRDPAAAAIAPGRSRMRRRLVDRRGTRAPGRPGPPAAPRSSSPARAAAARRAAARRRSRRNCRSRPRPPPPASRRSRSPAPPPCRPAPPASGRAAPGSRSCAAARRRAGRTRRCARAASCVLEPVGAHRPRLGEALVQERGGLAHLLLHAAGGAADALAEAAGSAPPPAGTCSAAIRNKVQSRYSIEPTRPMIVTASRNPLTARVSASRISVASVVKRAASCAGGLALDLLEVRAREVHEQALLQLADHQQHELLDGDGLPVLRSWPSRGDDHDDDRHLVEDALVAGDEHRDGAVDDHRVEPGQPGHRHGQHEHDDEPPAMMAHVLAPQPQHERARALVGGNVYGRGRVHARRVSGHAGERQPG